MHEEIWPRVQLGMRLPKAQCKKAQQGCGLIVTCACANVMDKKGRAFTCASTFPCYITCASKKSSRTTSNTKN